jgi:acyl carrier protein
MHTMEQVKILLADTLCLGARAGSLRADSALLGSIPELDSAAVIDVITGLEERFGIRIDDDEIGAALFDTVGSLTAFVEQKLAQ